MRAALVVVALLAAPAAATAAPWRGALGLELHRVASLGAGASPTLKATGIGLHLRGERSLPRSVWSIVAAADAGVTGEVVVGDDRIARSSLALIGVAAGVGTDLGPRWRWRGLVGPSRVYYLSPHVIGDGGWDAGLAVEVTRSMTAPRLLNLGATARLASMMGHDGGAMRATIVVSLGLELGIGR